MTLLIVLIYYKVSLRKKLKDSKIEKVEEEGNSTMANHLDVSEKRRDLFLQANSSLPWDREVMTLDPRTDYPGHQFKSRVAENDGHFWCPECTTEGQRGMGPNPMRWNNRINAGMEADEEIEKRRVRMMTEQERRRLGTQQRILNRDLPNKFLSHGNTNSSSHPQKETFGQRSETLIAYTEMGDGYRTDMEGNSKRHETLHCKSCHRTYRPPEQNMRKGRIHTNMRDSALFNGFPSQYGQIDKSRNVNHNQFDMMKNTEFRRETRNVTFDLERSRTLEQESKDKREEEERTPRDEERGRVRTHKSRVQSSRLLKVKLNLNPLRKSKVHPKRKTEQGHSEKSSSKKSKDKRKVGKEGGEREGKGRSGKKTKSSEKIKKSTKTKGSTMDGEEEKEEDKREAGQKSQRTSKRGQSGQGSIDSDQGENKHPENSEPVDATNTADQSASAIANGQGQNLQGGHIQYQGAGLILESAQLPSQHTLSLSASDRNHSTHLSLLSSVGSQLTGHSPSLQGGNFLLNTMAPGSNSLFPGYPANSIAPGIAISAANMAPSGASGSFNIQAGVMPPVTPHPANTVHANPLQASPIHTSPLHTAQPAGLASSSTANPAVNPAPAQSLSLPPDSSPLTERLKSDPAQGPGPQTGTGLHQLLPESQAPQSFILPTQAPPNADGFSGVTPPAPVTTVETLSNNKSSTETGRVHSLTEGLTVGVSGDSMQAADVPLSSVSAPSMSTQSVSSTGDAVATAALLQQEYLSEEGGSSPRRKLRLVLPEKTSSRPPTALERKIR